MTLSLQDLRELSQAGSLPLLIIGMVILWRRYTALQSRHEARVEALQARYEAVLEKCITALVRVNDYMDDHEI